MAVLGWIALGLATAVLASGFQRGEEGRDVLAGRYASCMAGALFAGLVAAVAGVGPIEDFFHIGTWLIALAGAILALVAHEIMRSPQGRGERTGASGSRTGRNAETPP